MRARIGKATILGVFALLMLAVAGSDTSSAQTTQASLTATPPSITMTVLAGHTSQAVSVAVTASQPIPASKELGAAMLGDLVRDDAAARIPPAAFTPAVTRDTTDPNNESFALTLTPSLAGAAPGKYSGNVRVTGPGTNSLVVPITVNLQGGSAAGTLPILLVGVLVGWLLKWYTDSGSKLAAETRRYQRFRRKLGTTPSENLPKFVGDEIDDVNQGFNDLDQETVDDALTKLEAQIAGIPAIADVAAHIRQSMQEHDDEIKSRGLPYGRIMENERRRLNDALNEAKDLEDAKNKLTELLVHVNAITDCLQNPADAGHARVLNLYDDDRFDDALNTYNALPVPSAPAGVAAGAVAGGGAANPARLQSLWTIGTELERRMAGPGWQASAAAVSAASGDLRPAADSWQMDMGRRWRSFLGKGLPLLIGALSVLVLALIGLKTQWSSNLVFGSGGIIDDVALFLWGVAAFVTGKTVSDFLSTVTTS